MEVSIVFEGCIKPSSPTPYHQKTYLLSFIDQLFPTAHFPVIFFYPFHYHESVNAPLVVDDIVNQRLQLLKQSLCKILGSFFPLAGRLKDNLSFDCNDDGVYYVEATVKSNLFEFLKQPELDPSFLHKLVPGGASTSTIGATPPSNAAMIQVTAFACGGIAICVSISHMIADALSVQFFMKSWADSTLGIGQIEVPNFEASTLFPQTNVVPRMFVETFHKLRRYVFKRFGFNAEAIATLKAKASNSTMQNPSRTEVVSALICKCIARPIYTTQSVNIRSKAAPSFPNSYMGNYVCTAGAELGMVKFPDLVIKLREAITKKYDFEFVKDLKSGPTKYFEILKEISEAGSTNGELDLVAFSSLCNLDFYDIEFGWGKPLWVAIQPMVNSQNHTMNAVFLMDTRSGEGVEAWICLDEESMATLQRDKEWISFASVDPSPLTLYMSKY